ncbi:MAG: glycerol kinase GlpK [Azospirillaceae bacterium]|nr:glycerol kinase GlpK [Azospirillaceae bacterium]
MTADLILAIDQGTTSTRAILFDAQGRPLATAQRELPQHYPGDGQVEHDPEDIWRDTVAVCRGAVEKARVDVTRVAAIGITNQRETTLVWDRATGEALHPAIVWQDRRTSGLCQTLRREGAENLVRARTGLLLDPYFSATKLAWILDTVPGARTKAEAGQLCFGTIDCFLLWRLTGGAVHATDATNAARTLLYDLHTQDWNPELLRLFGIPAAILPQVRDNAGIFGVAEASLLGRPIPIAGMAGDQQAAAIGQACLAPGMIKSTYGTGCFALMNIGDRPRPSTHRLLTTLAYRLDGRASFALEGSIFVAGAAVQWLRDGLGLIPDAASSQAHAQALADTGGVYLVPAFTGLGAPYWDPDARGAILGLTRDSGVSHIVRAALESVCYQTRDLMTAMAADSGCELTALRVDGGMVANDWLMQFLADQLDLTVERPLVTETTALGAAFLAGLAVGLFPSLDAISGLWREERRFEAAADPAARERLYDGWQRAVARVRSA